MTTRPILSWPDDRLTIKCEPITEFDEELRNLIGDMIDTLNVNHGIGLAAPQVGVLKKVVVIKRCDITGVNSDENLILINPSVKLSGKQRSWKESCLSVPGFSGRVARALETTVTYQDDVGDPQSLEASWPLSAVIQHECDHLDGVLYLQRMKRTSQRVLTKRLRNRKKKEQHQLQEYHRHRQEELVSVWAAPSKKKPASKRPAAGELNRKKVARNSRRRNRG